MRPVGGNKDLYCFSGPCTIFTNSCSARQNPHEFFLHEYVNFVLGTEKPYSSLSTKIYIFMQCAPKSFGRFSSLRADVEIGHRCPISTPPYRAPNMAGVVDIIESGPVPFVTMLHSHTGYVACGRSRSRISNTT